MTERIRLLWTRLRNSLWALPLAFCLGGAALAIGALRIRPRPGGDPVWWLYSGNAADASTFIAHLLSAMITMSTLAISITMVVLTLAAQSLGPRLISIFMSDNRTKLSLGLLLGTVVYLLLVLRSIAGATTSVPNLAVTLAVALSLLSVLTLPFFVHHLATAIVADTVVERVGAELDRQIYLLPPRKDEDERGLTAREEAAFQKAASPVSASTAGYIRAIHYAAICKAVAEHDAEVLLAAKPGALLLEGETFGWIKSKRGAHKEIVDALERNLILGADRSPAQDLEYSIRQLVEIALRALSPGINDPHTASAVVDRLATSLALLMKRRSEAGVWRDEKGNARIYRPSTNFSALLSAAFTEIRQAGANVPTVLLKLAQRGRQLSEIAPEKDRAAIREQLEMLETTMRHSIKNPADRKALLASISG